MRKMLLLFTVWFVALSALADPCPPANVICPSFTLCSTWTAPAVRRGGAALPVSELQSFELTIGATIVGTVPGSQSSFNYTVPTDTTIAANSLFSIVAIDTDGQRGDIASCTLPKAIAGPKSAPGAPGNVKVQ